jgi:transglutaminase-like putative cysteine protease
MKLRLFCNQALKPQAIRKHIAGILSVGLCLGVWVNLSWAASDAPAWMHALVNAPLPAHDEKTDAIRMYVEENVTVLSADKIRVVYREAYKILRPGGREAGTVIVSFDPNRKITSLHGWCIPAQGKDFEVKDKDAVEIAQPKAENSELVSDVRAKLLRIPASDVGNIVGYEYEAEERPLVLQDHWLFQEESPTRESHYTLQLPPGWEYKATFLNYPEIKATQSGTQISWAVSNVEGLKREDDMPPIQGLVGQMILSFFPQGGPSTANGFSNWREMGLWYSNLMKGRLEASPEIKQRVQELTASSPSQIAKMKALANFVQHDIRYVAIQLGIGGWQPHPAAEVFSHRYGDCKDKATLMRSMLRELGVDSYQVAINTERGSVGPETPAYRGFNHQILALKLPDNVINPELLATLEHPKLGRLLFFDPTNDLTPFGRLPGYLQANWGLLIAPDGGEMVKLPKQSGNTNSIQRTAKLTLDATGTLVGDVQEIRLGDRAASQRYALKAVTRDVDKIKPIEILLADSLSTFQITKASLSNLNVTDQPFGFQYTFHAQSYAKNAGDLLLVRPRVIGTKSRGLLETKEPRKFPIEFDGPVLDTDTFEITLPDGYAVDDLPPAVDADIGFASYHSKTELKGNVIHYTRAFEIKELSVPVNKAEELKKFYRTIAGDERNTAVLKPMK